MFIDDELPEDESHAESTWQEVAGGAVDPEVACLREVELLARKLVVEIGPSLRVSSATFVGAEAPPGCPPRSPAIDKAAQQPMMRVRGRPFGVVSVAGCGLCCGHRVWFGIVPRCPPLWN